jgi:ubiquinone/menaquinone biosynthesis C-methylase UbiE
LRLEPAGARCPRCGTVYGAGPGGVVEFLPDLVSDEGPGDFADCWDDAASADEIEAAAALPKAEADGIFVKMPKRLDGLDLDGKVYLDLGCGYGRTLIHSATRKHPAVAIGIDVSNVMLAKARSYSEAHSVSPVLLRAGVDRLPLVDQSVDVVYSNAVLLHVPKPTAAAAIAEVARVLKPGGVALFESTFVGWLNPDGIQHKLITSLGSRRLRPAWVRTYRYGELRAMIQAAASFSAVEIAPDSYAVAPTSLFKLQSKRWKLRAARINASASRRLGLKSAFVKRWSVRLVK